MQKTLLATMLLGCCITAATYAKPTLNDMGTFEQLPQSSTSQLYPTSRAVYQHNDDYDVFIGYISANSPFGNDAALHEFAYPNEQGLPIVTSIPLPNILNKDNSSNQPKIVMTSVSKDTLYVGETQGTSSERGGTTEENQGRYLLAQAQLNKDDELKVIAQTGELGLPKQLINSNSNHYGYVFWYGLISKIPTVIFANQAANSNKASFSVYQQNVSGKSFEKTGTFATDYVYQFASMGLLSVTGIPQVITSKEHGTALLFSAYQDSSARSNTKQLLELSFNQNGKPNSSGQATRIKLPEQPNGDDFYSAYYESKNQTLYVSMQKQGAYQAPFTLDTTQPDWKLVAGSQSCIDPNKQESVHRVLSIAPMLGNSNSDGLNVIVQNDGIDFNAYALTDGKCTLYPIANSLRTVGKLFNVNNQYYFTADQDVYLYQPASNK